MTGQETVSSRKHWAKQAGNINYCGQDERGMEMLGREMREEMNGQKTGSEGNDLGDEMG